MSRLPSLLVLVPGTRSQRLSAVIALSFAAAALVQTWPLALHLPTHLTGIPGGDAGVYVWNVWHFRHRLVDLGASPFWSEDILPLGGTANLALHNYTVFADLLALPLQSFASVITSFNIVYIVNVALTGVGMFVLARRVTGQVAEAWLAGLLFMWSPFLVSRGASHFSLAAAAPLPFFMYSLDRAWTEGRLRHAVFAGASVAWAFYCDPYYAVYTAMLFLTYVGAQSIAVERAERAVRRPRPLQIIDVAAVLILVASAGLVLAGRTLYTPMLILAVLLTVRAGLQWKVRFHARQWPRTPVRLALAMIVSAAVLLAPEFHALGLMTASGTFVEVPVLWRSSAPGVDAVAFVLPNPNHLLAPGFVHDWLATQPGGYDENVASISYVAAVTVLLAWRRATFRPPGMWVAITLGAASIALGPFVRLFGLRTFFPTPWAVGRYLPVIGEARMPQRFSVLVIFGLSVLFAYALTAVGRRWPEKRRAVMAAAGLALAIELWPAPRAMFAADIPDVFEMAAADPRPLRLLELPFGLRDGLSSLGNFSAASQLHQTKHAKGLVGGYISRISERTQEQYRHEPVTHALIEFAEGRTPSPELLDAATRAGPAFVERMRIGYVVIDLSRTTPIEREFVIAALGLRVGAPADDGGRFELYVTGMGGR